MTLNTSSSVEYDQFWQGLIDQLTSNKGTPSRPMTIFINIDYNTTNMHQKQIEYALQGFRNLIQSQFSLLSPAAKIIFPLVYGIVILVGLFSNLLMIYAFYRAEKLRTFRNVFIINLAISDILLSLICAPLTLFRYVETKWTFGRILCKIGPGLQTTNVMVIAFSITTIAIDRWQYISNLGRDKTKKMGLFICISIIWMMGFIIAIPSFIVNDLKIFKLGPNETLYKSCEEIWINDSYKYTYSIMTIIFQYVLPLIIVTLTNLKICHYLYFKVPAIYSYTYKRRKPDTANVKFSKVANNNNDNKEIIAEVVKPEIVEPLIEITTPITFTNELTNNNNNHPRPIFLSDGKFVVHDHERFSRSRYLLIAVCLSFAISWLPLLLLNLALDFYSLHADENTSTYFLISHLFATLSTIINPIIYGLLNTNFKKEFVRIMTNCQL